MKITPTKEGARNFFLAVLKGGAQKVLRCFNMGA